ncbi:DUF1501 domain-containing protein [Stieleria mannarensis]|uniref:DUF1501 domain-containing protein n=1 Tax=Stieleria mannarensis TaxID=2755585 RepID=UPI0016016127|nr:DUF1501 domain-containing protein [Rhodopirellula sp. JC639]
MQDRTSDAEFPNRREFATRAAQALLGVTTLPTLGAFAADQKIDAAAKAERVIYFYMSGGMSHLDTFDLKPGAATQGPVEAIDTNVPGVRVASDFGRLARQMDKVAVINSMTTTQGAHAQGRYYMHTSYFQLRSIKHPELGAYAAMMLPRLNPTLPANVKIGGNSSGLGAGFLESKYAALPIGDPQAGLPHSKLPRHISDDRFARRIRHVRLMNQLRAVGDAPASARAYTEMYDEAVNLMNSRDIEAFDLTKEPAAMRERYGDTRLGQATLLARRLVEHDVRFVEVGDGGWDTHSDNFSAVARKAAILDRALATLLADLAERGLLASTLVVLATEFGRTPRINPQTGRDHYPAAFTCLLAGGGIRGGQVYGRTDREGREVEEDLVTVPDFNATIATALGLPIEKTIYSPSRRPFTVAHDGQPIERVLG